MIWGKAIGGILGFVIGHNSLLGALAGLAIGHWIDLRLGGGAPSASPFHPAAARGGMTVRREVFTTSVVNLAAKLAKVDGQVVRAEIDAFKAVFTIGPGQNTAIGALYDEAKLDPSGYEEHARRLASTFADSPLVLAEVLAALHRIALADGRLDPAERTFLETVARIFGLPAYGFGDELPRAPADETDPYAVLGVARAAPMSEIKAMWRKLTREHHPDAMMARGVPKEYVDLATTRMAAINAAYDRIRAERGES